MGVDSGVGPSVWMPCGVTKTEFLEYETLRQMFLFCTFFAVWAQNSNTEQAIEFETL